MENKQTNAETEKMATNGGFTCQKQLLDEETQKKFVEEARKNLIFTFLDKYVEEALNEKEEYTHLDDLAFSGLNYLYNQNKVAYDDYDILSDGLCFMRDIITKIISECPYISITIDNQNKFDKV